MLSAAGLSGKGGMEFLCAPKEEKMPRVEADAGDSVMDCEASRAVVDSDMACAPHDLGVHVPNVTVDVQVAESGRPRQAPSESVVADADRIFDMVANGAEFLDVPMVIRAMRLGGRECSREQAKALVDMYDVTGDGLIEGLEWIHKTLRAKRSSSTSLMRAG